MSWSDTRRFARIFVALAFAGLTAGCFQPLYAERPTAAGHTGVADRLSSVDVASIDAPSGSRLARVSAGVRNELIYDLTGGAGGASPLYRLNIRLSATQLQIIVDINTARPDINNYGIDAVYTLTEIATGKPVTKGQTASSSYKPAVLSNGVRTMVPPFVGTGTKIVVMTADGSYVERAKD